MKSHWVLDMTFLLLVLTRGWQFAVSAFAPVNKRVSTSIHNYLEVASNLACMSIDRHLGLMLQLPDSCLVFTLALI